MNNYNIGDLSREIIENCCRTCLEQKDLKPIFAINYERKPVADLLFYCVALKVEENNEMPDKICSSCFGELIRIFTFKQKCHATNKILEIALNKFKVEKSNKQEQSETTIKVDDLEKKLVESQLRKINKPDNFIHSTEELKTVNEELEARSKSLKCNICSMEFEDINSLKTHKKEMKHVIVKNHTCLVCNKSFTKSKLKQHMRIHTKEKPFQCNKCFKRFSMVWNLNRHMMSHTGEKPYVCDICGKGFIQAITLTEHKRTHTGDAPYVCSYCGKRFIRSSRHKTHLKMHLQEREHLKGGDDNNQSNGFQAENRCPICSRLYASSRTLRMHMMRHGEKTLLCSDCGKKFYTKNNLISHSKIHKGEKLHVCKQCNKAFTFASTLKTHTLVHTSQKPYVCKICLKSFKQHNHLKYHSRVHSGEKPYTCICCDKTFALNTNLTVHLRTHTGETPYVCNVCDKGYNRLNNMKVHQATHKQEKPSVEDFVINKNDFET